VSLAAVRANLADAAILLDFDGTLAPIVAAPEDARPVPGADAVLRELAGRARAVAIVTGRPSSFVRGVLDAPDVEVLGLYGLEGAPPLDPDVVAEVRMLVDAVPGATVEDKGASVAAHVRRTHDPEAALAELRPPLRALADRHGLAMLEGKLVLEVAPRGARKAGAVRRVLDRAEPRAALYAGDDAEDVEAFAALAEAGLPMCRVAVTASGTPERLVEVADVHVEGPDALVALLRSL
jgi:trehalose 6-phosphate phosphatase